MRRKDREIEDRADIDRMLLDAKVCRVAFAADGEPYLVPLSHGYAPSENALFFHTAKEGRKIDCIAANSRVCFEVEGTVDVKEGDERGCSWGMRYESVIGYGTFSEVVDRAAKEAALRVTMRQQSGREADWTFAEKMLNVTRVWRLDIESVTGKRSFKPAGA